MLNQDQASETWVRIKDFIGNRSADITYEEQWGTRRLAYPIRKGSHQFLEGSYHLTRFSTETSFNRELHTFLRLDEQILRSLVVVAQPPGIEPDTPAQVRAAAARQSRGVLFEIADLILQRGDRPLERLALLRGLDGIGAGERERDLVCEERCER